MNALLSKVKENSVESVLELHQAGEEFSAEVPKAIALSVVQAISTDKMPEPSLTITKAQGKTTKNRGERFYFPSCCPQKEQKKDIIRKNADGAPPQSEPELIEKALSVSGSVLTLLAEVNGMSVDEESSTPSRAPPDEVVEAVYKDLLQEKGSAIKLHQAVEQCSAEVPKVIAWSLVKEISTAPPNEFLAAPAFLLSSVLLLSGHPSKAISLSGNAKSLVSAASDSLPKDESQKRFGLLPKLPKTHKMQKMPKLKAKNKVDPLAISFDLLREDPLEDTYDHS
eukprot:XP_014002205.1 PREDICTED: uncharacterized protein LOC106572498 [Salmo salar]